MVRQNKKASHRLHVRDLQNLRAFSVVARAGGLTAAQAELGLSLPQISALISDFERRFHMKLCSRGRGGFALTPAGERVLGLAESLLERFSDLENEIGGVSGSLYGTLCIAGHGGDYSHPEYLLPEVIRRFMARPNNHADLRMEIGSQSYISNGVISGMIDIGIGQFSAATDGVIKHHLYCERASLYCGRGHPLFTKDASAIAITDLAHFDFALRSRKLPNIPDLPPLHGRAIAPTQEARALMVLSGKFLAFLPDHVASRWTSKGDMRRVGAIDLFYETEMQIIRRNQKVPSPLVTAFLEDYALASMELNGKTLRLLQGSSDHQVFQ